MLVFKKWIKTRSYCYS